MMSMSEHQETLLDAVCRHAARLAEAGLKSPRRVQISAGDTSVEIEWEAREEPAGSPPSAGSDAPMSGDTPGTTHTSSDVFTIDAPTVGTFYSAPEPGAKPFAEVGDAVSPGQQVAILEAMKLMNAIDADRPGRIVEVCVSNAQPVEYGQPLFVLVPIDDN